MDGNYDRAALETNGYIVGTVTTTTLLAAYGGSPPGWLTVGAIGIGNGVELTCNYYATSNWVNTQ